MHHIRGGKHRHPGPWIAAPQAARDDRAVADGSERVVIGLS